MLTIKSAFFASGIAAALGKAVDQEFYATPFDGGVCPSGTKQSPINLVVSTVKDAPASWTTDLSFPTVGGLNLQNTGHGMQLNWGSYEDGTGDIKLQVTGDSLNALFSSPADSTMVSKAVKPLQLHFHSVSEHAIDGFYDAAEVHIVSAIAEGEATEWGCDTFWQTGDAADLVLDKCITVFGVMYKLGDSSPQELSDMLDMFPLEAGVKVDMPGTFDLNKILPANRNYMTYEGSLTTPPCTEGLRWHVFETPMTMTAADVERMQSAVAATHSSEDATIKNIYRTNHRSTQPLNERSVYYVRPAQNPAPSSPAAEGDAPSTATEDASGVVAAALAWPNMLLATLATAALAVY